MGDVAHADSPSRAFSEIAVGFLDEVTCDKDSVEHSWPEVKFNRMGTSKRWLDLANHVVCDVPLPNCPLGWIGHIRGLRVQLEADRSELCIPLHCKFQQSQREVLFIAGAVGINQSNQLLMQAQLAKQVHLFCDHHSR